MNGRQGPSVRLDAKHVGQDEKYVAISIRSPQARLNARLNELSRAKTKVDNLIYDSQFTRNVCSDLMTGAFALLGINNCAIGASSDYHGALVSNGVPEGMIDTRGLVFLICACVVLGLFPQLLKRMECSKTTANLDDDQEKELERIVRYYQVPVPHWYVHPDPIKVKNAIEQRQKQILDKMAAGMFGHPDPIAKAAKLERSEARAVEHQNKRGPLHTPAAAVVDANDEKVVARVMKLGS